MIITTFDDAVKFLESTIPKDSSQAFMAEIGLARTKEFLRLLGNPEKKLNVIHIAGTSGKGSTAYMISALLIQLGFKVGLHVSPHVKDIRERLLINNKLISRESFIKHVNDILPTYQAARRNQHGVPTYFELMVGMALHSFVEEKVDYAVIETGMGGLYDGTNVFDDAVCVLTTIGLDHTDILGNTIALIAQQKAGIIHPGNTVISVIQVPEAKEMIVRSCDEHNAELHWVAACSDVECLPDKTVFNWAGMDDIEISLLGAHQAINCSVALATVQYISSRDGFDFDEDAARKALLKVSVPGRCETYLHEGKHIMYDGAHNPGKMHALCSTLAAVYPEKKFLFVVAFKKGKDFQGMIDCILPFAQQIIITEFKKAQDTFITSEGHAFIEEYLDAKNFKEHSFIQDPKAAVAYASNLPADVVVTGSLYLLGEVLREEIL